MIRRSLTRVLSGIKNLRITSQLLKMDSDPKKMDAQLQDQIKETQDSDNSNNDYTAKDLASDQSYTPEVSESSGAVDESKGEATQHPNQKRKWPQSKYKGRKASRSWGNKKLKPDNTQSKEVRREEGLPYQKKKVAMLLLYCGKGYAGMQINPGVVTIEDDLLKAFVKSGVVTEDHASQPGQKMDFQRAARTDKGVSAAGQVISLKMFIDVENPIEKINSHLPKQIKVLGTVRTTRGFDSKNACSGRTYSYLLPTFSFAPIDEVSAESYRVTDGVIEQVNKILALYKGTQNFHNFTSGKKPTDPSAKRYIIDFKCGKPFVRDGVEYAVIYVRGQSFMIHQIRKMIGLMLAIVRGYTGPEAIENAYGPLKADVPKAPGLGLVLDKVHYEAYNKKWGSDGMHDPIDWDKYKDEIEQFKEEHIQSTIIETEKTEKSMLQWLSTLPFHNFSVSDDGNQASKLYQAYKNVMAEREAAVNEEVNTADTELPVSKDKEKISSPANEDNPS